MDVKYKKIKKKFKKLEQNHEDGKNDEEIELFKNSNFGSKFSFSRTRHKNIEKLPINTKLFLRLYEVVFVSQYKDGKNIKKQ